MELVGTRMAQIGQGILIRSLRHVDTSILIELWKCLAIIHVTSPAANSMELFVWKKESSETLQNEGDRLFSEGICGNFFQTFI